MVQVSFFPGALYQIWWGGESEVDVRSGEKYVANFVHQLLYLCFFSVVILCARIFVISESENMLPMCTLFMQCPNPHLGPPETTVKCSYRLHDLNLSLYFDEILFLV